MTRALLLISLVLTIANGWRAECVRAQEVIQVQSVNLQGTVLNVTPQAVMIRTATGDYIANVVNQGINIGPAQVEIHGNESPEFLQAGMFVRFEAELEFRRRVVGKVSQLKLIALNNQPALPAVQPGGLLPRQFGAPGLPQLGGAPNPLMQPGFFRLDAPAGADEPGRRGQPAIPKLAQYAVVGRVATPIRRNTFSIAVPVDREVKILKVPLAKDAKVELFLTDIRYARVGDKITAKGDMPIGPNQRQFWATHVKITRGDVEEAVANVKPILPGDRVDFGELGKVGPAKDDGGAQFEGVILKIN